MEQERTKRKRFSSLKEIKKRLYNLKKRDKIDTDFKKTGKRQDAVTDRDNVQN